MEGEKKESKIAKNDRQNTIDIREGYYLTASEVYTSAILRANIKWCKLYNLHANDDIYLVFCFIPIITQRTYNLLASAFLPRSTDLRWIKAGWSYDNL